jgi:hypothetical protein
LSKTVLGFWSDPPGYFDNYVYKAYMRYNQSLLFQLAALKKERGGEFSSTVSLASQMIPSSPQDRVLVEQSLERNHGRGDAMEEKSEKGLVSSGATNGHTVSPLAKVVLSDEAGTSVLALDSEELELHLMVEAALEYIIKECRRLGQNS